MCNLTTDYARLIVLGQSNSCTVYESGLNQLRFYTKEPSLHDSRGNLLYLRAAAVISYAKWDVETADDDLSKSLLKMIFASC